MDEYQQREIYAYGRYITCQVLNWQDGPPPEYLICHPLDKDHHEEFLARKGMGTWMRVDLREVIGSINEEPVSVRRPAITVRECTVKRTKRWRNRVQR